MLQSERIISLNTTLSRNSHFQSRRVSSWQLDVCYSSVWPLLTAPAQIIAPKGMWCGRPPLPGEGTKGELMVLGSLSHSCASLRAQDTQLQSWWSHTWSLLRLLWCVSSLAALRCSHQEQSCHHPFSAQHSHLGTLWDEVGCCDSHAFCSFLCLISHMEAFPLKNIYYICEKLDNWICICFSKPKDYKKRLKALCLSLSQMWLESTALRTSPEKTGKDFPKSNPIIK